MKDARGCYAPAGSVTLTGRTPYTENRDRMLLYLRILDADMMLYSFRRTFGCDTRGCGTGRFGAELIPGGWEAPGGLLRGHTTGHMLSALALAFAATGDGYYKEKASYIVSELRRLQKLSHGVPSEFRTACDAENAGEERWSHDPDTWGEGYIGAYPPDQFALLELLTPYPSIWAPYYTLHKLTAGLLDCYRHAGIGEALDAARGIGDWVYDRLSAITPERRGEMWGLYIAGEYGGMNESLATLFSLTGEGRYLDAARMFDNRDVFDGLSHGVDTIKNRHANQHIPQIVGALAEYDATGDEYYRRAAENFFGIVTAHHMYATGGVGRAECFREPDALAANIDSDKNCETCAAYNMQKLARGLYAIDPENAGYMHYFERALVNHILPSQRRHSHRHSHAGVTYMLPVGPGAKMEYSDDLHTFTCCHGTGMENHVKYGDAQYFVTAVSGLVTVYVNLYISSEYSDPDRGIHIKIDSDFPFSGMRVTVGGDADYDVKLRVPVWSAGEPARTPGAHFAPGEYVKIEHKAGITETHELDFDYTLRLEYTPDTRDGRRVAALMYGPFVMAAKDPSTELITLKINGELRDNFTVSQNREAGAFCLVGFGREFVPLYLTHGEAYHAYFSIED